MDEDHRHGPAYQSRLRKAEDNLELIARGYLKIFDPVTVAGLLGGSAIGILLETKGDEAVQVWLDGLAEEWRDRRPPVEKISIQ